MINVSYVRQGETLGLGHAVLMARDLIGDEPFAVMLGDDIIDSPVPCMRQMIGVFEEHQGPVIAVHQVPREEISAYGVIDGAPEGTTGRVYRIRDMVEKPSVDEAPSDLAIIGRYILTPDIFEALEKTPRDRGGEIQLTNGLRRPEGQEAAVRLSVRRGSPRRGEQARVPQGHCRVCPEARGPGRTLSGVPEVLEALTLLTSSSRCRLPGRPWMLPGWPWRAPSRRSPRTRDVPLEAPSAGSLSGVVRDVPARALELNRRGREELLDFLSTGRTGRKRGVGEPPDQLEATALWTLVLVERHTTSNTTCYQTPHSRSKLPQAIRPQMLGRRGPDVPSVHGLDHEDHDRDDEEYHQELVDVVGQAARGIDIEGR